MNRSTTRHSPPTAQILPRRRRLLALLDAFGGRVGNVDFQKLLFLYCQEPNAGPFYEFVPYKFGAFSFTSYADRRRLIEFGLLEDDADVWRIAAAGKRLATGSQEPRMSEFATRYRRTRGDALVAEAYRRFPYYAVRSEIAGRVLKGDAPALKRIDAVRPKAATGILATIGYEGHSLESYLNVLLQAGVTLLCDVRRNPISRKYGFSKRTLANGCDGVGIRYEHLPDLGIASDRRRSLETQADYDDLFAEYEATDLPARSEPLATIEGWLASGAGVALTCFERLPQQCHRHCVADALTRRAGEPFTARHL